tara:strand:+ start:58473 stop:59174 length:702 start_codon:yes stop_codon:yes gene_type:complete
MKISVIIPVFNEKNTILKLYRKVKHVKGYKKKIIIVDDGSSDGSTMIMKKKIKNKNTKLLFHKRNLGKGAAIKTALKYISGDVVIIQDADLEYNPNDYHKLLKPFYQKRTKVVYGSRVLNKKRYSSRKSIPTNFRVFSNHVLTIFSNIINNQKLTDAHTCYKLFRVKLFKDLKLKENDFAFCPEVTTKLSNRKIKIVETPISYNGRGYDEGKKIGIYDAIRVVIVILKNKFFN